MEAREKLIDKVRKIRAKAHSEGATEAEAKLFLEKMMALMNDHCITEEELRDDVEWKVDHVYFDLKYTDRWRINLMQMCAMLAGCVAYQIIQEPKKMKVFGKRLSCEATIEMYDHLLGQVRSIAKDMYPRDTTKKRQAYTGLTMGLGVKVMEMVNVHNAAAGTNAGYDMSLPVIQEHKRVEEYVERTSRLRERDARSQKITPAVISGYQASDRVQIRRNVK